jgi:hypothetical protein
LGVLNMRDLASREIGRERAGQRLRLARERGPGVGVRLRGLINLGLALMGLAALPTGAHAVQTSEADVEVQGAGAMSVASAGDVNGDGADDLLTSGGGDAYVVFGGTTVEPVVVDGTVTAQNSQTVRGYRISAPGASVHAPEGDARLGDINGDGLGDFALVQHRPNGGTVNALVWVIFGKSGTAAQDLSNLGGGGYEIGPERPAALLNPQMVVDGAGDVNNDGLGDLIIGNVIDDLDGEDSGGAYVVFGKSSATPVDVNSIQPGQGLRIHGPGPSEDVGWSVAGLGRVNDDLLGDIAVATEDGVYVVFGRTDVADVYLEDLEPLALPGPTGGFKIHD